MLIYLYINIYSLEINILYTVSETYCFYSILLVFFSFGVCMFLVDARLQLLWMHTTNKQNSTFIQGLSQFLHFLSLD